MAGHIEAYLYSTGSKTAVEATTTLTADEGAAVPGDATLAAPVVFAAALTELQTALNTGGGANTYTVTWNAQGNTCEASGDSINFDLDFTGNLAAAMGFSASSYSGDQEYVGEQQALGRFDFPYGVERQTTRPGDDVDLREYQHGVTEVLAFGNHDLWRVKLWMLHAQATFFLRSYCCTGRVRLYQDDAVTTVASPTNLEGYLDGYVVASSEIETHGPSERLVSVGLVLAVPR